MLWSELSELSGSSVPLAVDESSDVAVEVSGTDMPDDDEANPGISPQSDTAVLRGRIHRSLERLIAAIEATTA